MSDRIIEKMEHATALRYAEELITMLTPFCERIEVAGSLRRKKPLVSDIEIVTIPKTEKETVILDMFTSEEKTVDLMSKFILEHPEIFSMRLNKNGSEAYGDKNKLLYYHPTPELKIPLDIFSAEPKNYTMVKFIRTGSYKNNIIVAVEARRNGYKIEQFEGGYKNLTSEHIIHCDTEEEVYKFLGLDYIPPENR
jgi:DNA polymerase/3'-5' exonuclease PolX